MKGLGRQAQGGERGGMPVAGYGSRSGGRIARSGSLAFQERAPEVGRSRRAYRSAEGRTHAPEAVAGRASEELSLCGWAFILEDSGEIRSLMVSVARGQRLLSGRDLGDVLLETADRIPESLRGLVRFTDRFVGAGSPFLEVAHGLANLLSTLRLN
jgi:hypothetical protein